MIVMNISIAIRSKRHNALWIGMMLMSMAQYAIRERYAMFVCFLLFPFRTMEEVQEDDVKSTNVANEEPSYDIDLGLADEDFDQDEGEELFQEITGSPFNIALDTLRTEGKNQCGFEHLLVPIPVNRSLDITNNPYHDANTKLGSNPIHHTQDRLTCARLIELTFRTDTSRQKRPQSTSTEDVDIIHPNGTKPSIIAWGELYGLDENQQGAFEVAASNFILTYHLETDWYNHDFNEQQQQNELQSTRSELEKLGAKQQLIIFMTSAGGTGKSNGITALIEYCKEF
eukprot:scaffold36442_cov81-Attheya_sp.AAC.1